MRESDFGDFSTHLDDVWSLKGQALTAGAKKMWFQSLEPFSLADIRGALSAHIRDPKRGQFLPMPADVIAQIERAIADDGRPGAEEAWALAMRSTDEAETIVWTAEAAEAMGVCRPILNAGDEVGARMAFKEAYTRIVDTARRERWPAAWTPSLGHDPERRDRAIGEAVIAGLLPASTYPALPAPRAAAPLLTASASQAGIPDQARAALLALREWLTSPTEYVSDDVEAKQRTASAKAAARDAVAAYPEGSK